MSKPRAINHFLFKIIGICPFLVNIHGKAMNKFLFGALAEREECNLHTCHICGHQKFLCVHSPKFVNDFVAFILEHIAVQQQRREVFGLQLRSQNLRVLLFGDENEHFAEYHQGHQTLHQPVQFLFRLHYFYRLLDVLVRLININQYYQCQKVNNATTQLNVSYHNLIHALIQLFFQINKCQWNINHAILESLSDFNSIKKTFIKSLM